MAALEKSESQEFQLLQRVNGEIPLSNSYSEFKKVDNLSLNDDSSLGKASHCINTIDELNDRIGNLSLLLNDFSNYEQGFSNYDSDEENVHESKKTSEFSSKSNNFEKERKEVKQFSGVYSFHSVVSSNNGKLKSRKEKKEKMTDTGSVSKKPMLVELHSFPGYDEQELTPLPISSLFILNVVIDAQVHLKNKRTLRLTFTDFFTSLPSVSIFQHCTTSQDKLFDRIARNYTALLYTWSERKFQDKLFKHYGNMIAQAIYATFCHAFPTSYRQFNGEFRDDLLSLISLWMMGSRPPPCSWENWNFAGLEPPGLRKGEKIQEDAAKGKSTDLEFEDRAHNNTRRSTRRFSKLLQPTSNASVTYNNSSLPPRQSPDQQTNSSKVSPKVSPTKSQEGDMKEDKPKGESVDNVIKQISSVLGITEKSKKKQSSPVGEGAVFSKSVFNVNGGSPLVEYYLASQNLKRHCQTSVFVQRTDIQSLPSVTSSETYEDLIENAKLKAEETREEFDNSMYNNAIQRRKFAQKLKDDNANFSLRATKLLSNPKEVRQISDLLKIPDKEEPDEADVRAARLRSLLVHVLTGDEESV